MLWNFIRFISVLLLIMFISHWFLYFSWVRFFNISSPQIKTWLMGALCFLAISFFLSSLLIALLLGVAFGNIISGIPLDAEHNVHVSLLGLLIPFGVLVGLSTVAMMAMHGAIYLTMKVDGTLLTRLKSWLPRLMAAFFILNTLVVLAVLVTLPRATARSQ